MTRFGNLNKQCSAAVITAEDTTANMLGTARDITVHDFTGRFSGDVYDQTQTDSSIKDGDVLDLGQGNVAIMVKAWPTIAVGEIEHFHTLESGSSFDTLEAGKYAASAVKAREVASKIHNNRNLQPVNSRFAAGDWMHLFEVGGRETECRVAIDSEKGELLIAMERVSSMAFQEIRGARFRDLAESVINANEAHKDPEEHGLERSSELPAWAAAILVERDQVSGNVQVFAVAVESESSGKVDWYRSRESADKAFAKAKIEFADDPGETITLFEMFVPPGLGNDAITVLVDDAMHEQNYHLLMQYQTSQGNVDDRKTTHMSPAWSDAHRAAAHLEGWDIWDACGSENGPWQIQHFDDASDIPEAIQLGSDDDALRIVVNGSEPHHEAARRFIRAHNPIEWAALEQTIQKMGNVESAKASRAVSLSETTLTFSLPDDFGAGWEYVNQRLHGASHSWAGSYDKSESANFAHEALMQVQGVVSSYLATGMTCNVSFVVNDIAEAAAIQSRLQAVVDAFESKQQRSISVRGSNFYDSSVTEYDANDPDVEIVSDMPFLNYLAKYVPMAEFLPALSGHDLAALREEADEHQLAKQADKDDLPSPGM